MNVNTVNPVHYSEKERTMAYEISGRRHRPNNNIRSFTGDSLDVKDSFSPSKRQVASVSIFSLEAILGYFKKEAGDIYNSIVKWTREVS